MPTMSPVHVKASSSAQSPPVEEEFEKVEDYEVKFKFDNKFSRSKDCIIL